MVAAAEASMGAHHALEHTAVAVVVVALRTTAPVFESVGKAAQRPPAVV